LKRRKLDTTTASLGSRQLNDLNQSLNGEFCSAKLNQPTSLRDFQESDSFHMSTQMTKKIVDVFEVFKENTECNFKISKTGIDVISLFCDKTVYVCIRLGKTIYSELNCPTNVAYCVNLSILAKRLSMLNRFKPRRFVFGNKGVDLMISGFPDNQAAGRIVINSLSSLVEELDTSIFKYDVTIRTSAEELARVIDAMPATFSLNLDVEEKALVFHGTDELSSTFLTLRVSSEALDSISKSTTVQNYKASFLKNNLMSLVRASKLSSFVVLGLHNKNPLFASYIITESCDLNPQHDSRVCLYFSPKTE
jgi:hypothetical protein